MFVRNEVQPWLYLHCAHSNTTLPLDAHVDGDTPVARLRSDVMRITGLPVGVFTLFTRGHVTLHDCHTLEAYNIQVRTEVLECMWCLTEDF